MGLGRKECNKTEASGARTVRSLLKATSKFLLCCKVDKTFVKKKMLMFLKGIISLMDLKFPNLLGNSLVVICLGENTTLFSGSSQVLTVKSALCADAREKSVLKKPLLAVLSA